MGRGSVRRRSEDPTTSMKRPVRQSPSPPSISTSTSSSVGSVDRTPSSSSHSSSSSDDEPSTGAMIRPSSATSPSSPGWVHHHHHHHSSSSRPFEANANSNSNSNSMEPWLPWPLAACLGLGVAGLALGVASNHGDKYIRLSPQEGCATSWKNIGTPVAGRTECCTAEEGFEAMAAAVWSNYWTMPRLSGSVCASGYKAERFLATFGGAWVLPLTPLALSWLGGVSAGGNRRGAALLSCRTRLGAYLCLMLFRTFGLYLAVNWIEDWFQGYVGDGDDNAASGGNGGNGGGESGATGQQLQPPSPPPQQHCDYAHLRRDGRCKDDWNMADHIVLFLTHHVAVAGSELAVLCAGATATATATASTGIATATALPATNAKHPPTTKTGGLSLVGKVAAAAAVAIVACAAYCTRQTAAFFHLPGESLAGLVVGLAAALAWRAAIARCFAARWR